MLITSHLFVPLGTYLYYKGGRSLKINWKVRFNNPIFWVQIIGGVLLTALTYNSMSAEELTTWGGVLSLLKGIVTNPYLLVLCLWNMWSSVNDPTTAGLGDSKQALGYAVPKTDKTAAKAGVGS